MDDGLLVSARRQASPSPCSRGYEILRAEDARRALRSGHRLPPTVASTASSRDDALRLDHDRCSAPCSASRIAVGSLIERGKDADLALFDGDPFEYTTKVTGVIIDGKIVSQRPR